MTESLQIPVEPFSWSGLNLEQTFRLVERYIPLKLCQSNKIIPLKFQNHCLTLGIVEPDNPSVHNIVTKLLGRKHLTLIGQQLDPQTFQLLLSSYLNYQQTNNIDLAQKSISATTPNNPYPSNSTPTTSTPSHSDGGDTTGLLGTHSLDQRETLAEGLDPLAIAPQSQASMAVAPVSDYRSTWLMDIQEPGDRPTLEDNNQDTQPDIPAVHVPHAPVQLRELSSETNGIGTIYNRLNLTPQYLDKPLDSLIHLPAKQLWQELLGRILSKGIGRLYFENYADEGRIFLSESGVMKEALYGLPIKTFYGVLNEFKRLAHIPPVPVLKAKKAEMEQYYLNERILLRLTIIPGKHGEEGTLQVLRGQALVFHQQKQMDDQGREALAIAQQLERKLRHIYLRSQINPSPLNSLPELMAACDRLKTQLENIRPRSSR